MTTHMTSNLRQYNDNYHLRCFEIVDADNDYKWVNYLSACSFIEWILFVASWSSVKFILDSTKNLTMVVCNSGAGAASLHAAFQGLR